MLSVRKLGVQEFSTRLNSHARSRPGYSSFSHSRAAAPVGLGASAFHVRSTRGSSVSGDDWACTEAARIC